MLSYLLLANGHSLYASIRPINTIREGKLATILYTPTQHTNIILVKRRIQLMKFLNDSIFVYLFVYCEVLEEYCAKQAAASGQTSEQFMVRIIATAVSIGLYMNYANYSCILFHVSSTLVHIDDSLRCFIIITIMNGNCTFHSLTTGQSVIGPSLLLQRRSGTVYRHRSRRHRPFFNSEGR